jgi:hypothetical protein
MTLTEPSVYVPSVGVAPVEPAWKGFDSSDLHRRPPTLMIPIEIFRSIP